MKTSKERARGIVAQGGQILLPFDAGDALVRFSSRQWLARLIQKQIEEAVEEALAWVSDMEKVA